jgi:hypothetical protein
VRRSIIPTRVTKLKTMKKSKFLCFLLFSCTDCPVHSAPTPVPGTPKTASPPGTPQLAPQGPSQLLSALLARLPDCTNRAMIDQAAIDFAFLNSKAARKRLVKVSPSTEFCEGTAHQILVPESNPEEQNRSLASLLETSCDSEQVHARRRS